MNNQEFSPQERAKQKAGYKAAEYVSNGMIIGLGTGSTVAFTMARLKERIETEGLSIHGVPTSIQTMIRATELGIPIIGLEQADKIDITIDGADQIDPKLRLIKGRGAAHVRERIIADASLHLIIVADSSKMYDTLSGPIPVEIIPFALSHVQKRLKKLGGKPNTREGVKKDGPVISDNGNIVLDYYPSERFDPIKLETEINMIPGVVSCGIFAEFASKTTVIIGDEEPKIITLLDLNQ
ncbi:MAG: ribose-5-phosphate isomerase RpiA [Methanomicrobiales archaeon]|nr:ribose-5-phosphate isomerase RpiA [Methanomicrobiales archaeon]